jgi:transcriptional regulator with XRE-family HTH domain
VFFLIGNEKKWTNIVHIFGQNVTFAVHLKFIIMSIGKNLKIIRNRNNISQQEIADFLGVDRKTYVSWEADTADIKSSYIPKLAEYLHVEIGDLFKEKKSDIVFNLQDNKDNSVNNGIVVFVTDKQAVSQLMDIMKGHFTKE